MSLVESIQRNLTLHQKHSSKKDIARASKTSNRQTQHHSLIEDLKRRIARIDANLNREIENSIVIEKKQKITLKPAAEKAHSLQRKFQPSETYDTLAFNKPDRDRLNQIAKVLSLSDEENLDVEDLLFFDTETTGLSRGAGTLVFLIGVGYFEKKHFIIEQFILDSPANERDFLMRFESVLRDKKLLISYNGKSFDIPLIRNRMIMNRMFSKIEDMPHLDLLHLTRKFYRHSLPNHRLSTIEQRLLRFFRANDCPGSEAPEQYRSFLKTKRRQTLDPIIAHNALDIASLLSLLHHLDAILFKPLASFNDDKLLVSRADFWFKCQPQKSQVIYQSLLERGIKEDLRCHCLIKLALIYKKDKHVKKAAELWHNLTEESPQLVRPWIELSQYYEHQVKNISKAIYYAERAPLFDSAKLKKRLNRLQRKLAGC